jgi:hypothetical protein
MTLEAAYMPLARCSECARTLMDDEITTIWADKCGKLVCDRCRAVKAAQDSIMPERLI